jgi:hypothetical protein
LINIELFLNIECSFTTTAFTFVEQSSSFVFLTMASSTTSYLLSWLKITRTSLSSNSSKDIYPIGEESTKLSTWYFKKLVKHFCKLLVFLTVNCSTLSWNNSKFDDTRIPLRHQRYSRKKYIQLLKFEALSLFDVKYHEYKWYLFFLVYHAFVNIWVKSCLSH